jgi:hypothetical protein
MLKHLNKFLKKLMSKEVKKGEKNLQSETSTDRNLKDLRKRQKQVETSRLKSLEKNMAAKKAKRKTKHRLGSTPGEIQGNESSPDNYHREGKQWIVKGRKKINTANKEFIKSSTKRS